VLEKSTDSNAYTTKERKKGSTEVWVLYFVFLWLFLFSFVRQRDSRTIRPRHTLISLSLSQTYIFLSLSLLPKSTLSVKTGLLAVCSPFKHLRFPIFERSRERKEKAR